MLMMDRSSVKWQWTPKMTEQRERARARFKCEITGFIFKKTDKAMDERQGRRIYCSGRDLHTISTDVFSFPDISYLELSPTREACLEFKLSELPKAIGRLTALRFLILDTNNLQTLPDEICYLRHLQVLVVSNNSLHVLPQSIGHMQELESLHLANNRLRDLPPSLFHLVNLTFLDLSSNKLRQISDQVGHLTQLRSLLLYDNRLRLLPESVGMLKHLSTLWLGHNRLRTLPRSLTRLKQLDWKNNYLSTIVDDNPLSNPPLDVCRQGFVAIDKWHRQNPSMALLDLDSLQPNHDGESSVGDTTNRFTLRRSPPYFA